MSSPTRRKSSLSGTSPVAPANAATDPAPPAQANSPAPADSAGTSSSRNADRQMQKPKTYAPKVSFYQDREDSARLRAAYRHTLAMTSDRSLSDFITRVVMAEVQRLEDEYNGGQPFPSVAAGELPQGRPVGE